jgi:hypothetical protein
MFNVCQQDEDDMEKYEKDHFKDMLKDEKKNREGTYLNKMFRSIFKKKQSGSRVDDAEPPVVPRNFPGENMRQQQDQDEEQFRTSI